MLNSDDLINKVKGYNKFLNPDRLNKALFNLSGFKNLLYPFTLFIKSSELSILVIISLIQICLIDLMSLFGNDIMSFLM